MIDGVEIVFHLTPGTEAPADMNMHYPALRTLNLAENGVPHDAQPVPACAARRRATRWRGRAISTRRSTRSSAGVDALVVQHHWPVWGRERIAEYVAGQRDMYRYLHDQTLRLMSHGLTPKEIAEQLMMPTKLSRQWYARGYYGAVAHNVNAIYAHYMGPYDGNPAHLNALPPEPAAAKYVEYMGGSEAILERARKDYDAGRFRWVVEVLNHLVFAEPGNKARASARRRRDGAARLPGRVGDVAQFVHPRRARVAQGIGRRYAARRIDQPGRRRGAAARQLP